ncbi:hypothetical protein JCM10207_006699 [Rhodosporidiobolus poonsookiae]
MPNSTLDDTSPSLLYSGPWTTYTGSEGLYDASGWHNGSFASCGGEGAGNSTACEVRVPFSGTQVALYGDANAGHGVFHCSLERTNSAGEREPEGVWFWGYAGAMSNMRPYQLNALLCQITSIPAGEHTLVLGVEADQVPKGIALDYVEITDDVAAGDSYSWSSFFNGAVPSSALRNTTATPSLPTETSSTSPTSYVSPTSSSSGGVNALAVGLGAGIGGAFALAALAIAFWLFYKRRKGDRRPLRKEKLPSRDFDDGASSVWYPGHTEVNALQASGGGTKTRDYADKEAGVGYEESPPSSFGYGGRAGYSPVAQPYGNYPTSSHRSSDATAYSPYAPSGFSPPHPPAASTYQPASSSASLPSAYLAPVPLPSGTGSPPGRRVSAAPDEQQQQQQHGARRASQYDFLDLPDDATLADPQDFKAR